MDYIEGSTLREWCDEHPDATAATRLRMLRMVASALDEMHSGTATEVPVAHGDVKPSNVVVRPDGGTVLVDLGLARLTDAAGVSGHSSPYAAPELRARGSLATPEADRYAFAVTTAQVLTGQPPPTGPDRWLNVADLETVLRTHPITQRRPALVKQILDTVIAPPEARPRQLRPWLDAAADTLSQITTTGPNRPPTQQLPRTASRPPAAATTLADTVIPPVASPPPKGHRRRRGQIIASVILAVAATVGAAAIALNRMSHAQTSANNGAAPAPTISAPVTASARPTTTATTPPPTSTEPGSAGVTSDSSPATAAVGPGAVTYLADLKPIQGNWYYSGTLSINGTSYAHALNDKVCGSSQPPRTKKYDLGRSFTSFHAVAGMSDNTDSDAISQVELFVDGVPQGKFTVQRGTVHQIDLQVRDTLTLKIIVSTVKGARCDRDDAGLTLGDPKLTS
jgi:serine/threonine protein kinase